jgi:hypothetical protein
MIESMREDLDKMIAALRHETRETQAVHEQSSAAA